MPLKKSTGNMYDWVTHMHTHLGGECSHKCSYCYVQKNRFGVPERYKGEPRLIEEELNVNYGKGKTIFIEHMNDLFANTIQNSWIVKILRHCLEYPENNYVFQSKDPGRCFLGCSSFLPEGSLFGTTIETNRDMSNISTAPHPNLRYQGIKYLKKDGIKTFITIEPIMDFDDELAEWIIDAKPNFVNIGADSKRSALNEPSAEKVQRLIKRLQDANITIRKKTNLGRLEIKAL